jgi:L-asparaginase/Glu-tRNA(Gln) amidotransferase subunit D
MDNYRIYRQPLAAIGIVVGLLFWSPSHARDADDLPNVMILATGGTIAGTGTTSTTSRQRLQSQHRLTSRSGQP